MRKNSYFNIITLLITFSMIFTSLAIADDSKESEKGKLIEYVVAKINDKVITWTEFKEAKNALKEQEVYKNMDDDELSFATLESLIDGKMVNSIAEIFNITPPEKLINQRIESIKKENNIATDEELEQQLQMQGVSLAWLRSEMQKSYIYQTVIMKNVYNRINVPEDDIKDYYARHIREYSKDSEIRIRQIFVSFSDKTEYEAKETIDEANASIDAGMEFETALEKYADPEAKINGGDLGYFKKGEIIKEIDEAASKLKKGEISGIIRSGNGYHIIQVTDRKEAETVPLASVREEIVNKLKADRLRDEAMKYMKELRSTYFVEIMDPDLKKLYDKKMSEYKKNQEAGNADEDKASAE